MPLGRKHLRRSRDAPIHLIRKPDFDFPNKDPAWAVGLAVKNHFQTKLLEVGSQWIG